MIFYQLNLFFRRYPPESASSTTWILIREPNTSTPKSASAPALTNSPYSSTINYDIREFLYKISDFYGCCPLLSLVISRILLNAALQLPAYSRGANFASSKSTSKLSFNSTSLYFHTIIRQSSHIIMVINLMTARYHMVYLSRKSILRLVLCQKCRRERMCS